MLKKLIFFASIACSTQAFAQEPVLTTNNRDSNMVKFLFFTGLREKLNENYVMASSNFTKVIGVDPKNHAAYFELANSDFKQDKLAEAEINLKKAVALNAENVWYWRLLSEIYKRGNRMPELIGVFDQLIHIDPENDAYYFDKANAFYLSGKADSSKFVYNQIEQKFGNSRDLENARKRFQQVETKSESDIIKLLEGNQADSKNYLYAAGLLLQKGNIVEASKVLIKAQQLSPDDFEVNLALADVYRRQKNDEAAFAALKQAFKSAEMPLTEKIKIVIAMFPAINSPVVATNLNEMTRMMAESNPEAAKAQALYGDVLYQQNNLSLALEQYQKALKLDDQVYAVWEQTINLQTLMGKYAEAIKLSDEALTLYPNQASLYYYSAYALFKSGKADAALANLKLALQLDTENKALQTQIFALQGDIYINQNNFNQAKVCFEKALALEPQNYLIMNNYAYYLALRNDDLVKAAAYAKLAAEAMPNNPSVADTYAFILFKQQKYDLAQQWIEKALQNNTNKDGVYLERYGDILYFKGDKDGAVIQWIKAKSAGNGSDVLIKKINEKKYIK